MSACRCAGGHTSEAALAPYQRDLDLQRGVATRIENLSAPHRFDGGIHPRIPSLKWLASGFWQFVTRRRLDPGEACIAPTGGHAGSAPEYKGTIRHVLLVNKKPLVYLATTSREKAPTETSTRWRARQGRRSRLKTAGWRGGEVPSRAGRRTRSARRAVVP